MPDSRQEAWVGRGSFDADRQRIHLRDSKGNKERLLPLPVVTQDLLRRFWQRHRNPVLLFPSRQGGLTMARAAPTLLNCGGASLTLRKAVPRCGIKKIT